MQTLAMSLMLKLFVGVLASQTKLYRVKQGTERGSRGYFNKQYVLKWFVIRLQRTLTSCVSSLSSFVDSKAQLRYLWSPSTALYLLVLCLCASACWCWNAPNKLFLWSRRSTMMLASVTTLHHFERWSSVSVLVGPEFDSWPTHTEGGNSWTW